MMVIYPKKGMMLFGEYLRMPLKCWMDISGISISRNSRFNIGENLNKAAHEER